MENIKKFYRGKNYNNDDKYLLLSLVESKRDILESKCTNKVSRESKREAWSSITEMYNAGRNTPRTASQLKILYENLKRRTKQDVAMENKERYREIMFPGQQMPEQFEEREEPAPRVEQLKSLLRQEKKEIQKTGGGTMGTYLTDTDCRIISMVGVNNITPLNNAFDDASIYFGESMFAEILEKIADPTPIHASPSPIPVQNADASVPSHCQIETRPSPIPQQIRKPPKKLIKRKLSLKEQYYKQKLKNARIEAKILMIQLRREKIQLKKAM